MKEYIIDAAKTVLSDISDANTIVSLVITEQSQKQSSEEGGVVSKLMDKALKGDFNNSEELKVKKLAAAALAIAKAKGVIPESMNAQSLAALADEGISRIKADYQVGAGIIDPYEAADKLIDQATARTAKYLTKAAPLYISKGVDVLASVIIRAYPPAAPVVMFVKEPVKQALNKVAQVAIEKGLAKINQAAKFTVRTIGRKVTTFAKNVLKQFAIS